MCQTAGRFLTEKSGMILARLGHSIRSHDWFTALIELVLLVMGIFFGFQLDRWNDERLDGVAANEYRLQLIADLEVERSDLEVLIDYHKSVRDYAEVALNSWDQPPSVDSEALIVALYQASNILPVTAARGAYDALTANGLIDLIGGPSLTSRLAAYYGQPTNRIFEEEKRYRRELRGVMPIDVQRLVRERCISFSVNLTINEGLADACDLDLDLDYAGKVLASVKAHPNIRNYLREAFSRDLIFIYLMGAKLEVVDSLLADLRAG
jgi:hypothetical protein